MDKNFNLEEYLSKGVENDLKIAFKASFANPKESAFIAKFAISSKKAAKIRKNAEIRGQHIPTFLIASITNQCNLYCKGCYARENHICNDEAVANQLEASKWKRIFSEAQKIGISFILLAGGEPLVREDVIDEAAKIKKVVFPIFTNGTMLNGAYIEKFKINRNLLPIISLEGDEALTDKRRGKGVFQQLAKAMKELKNSGILYGTSITVTKENLKDISNDNFIKDIYDRGSKIVFLIEYVPVDEDSIAMAPDDGDRKILETRISKLRGIYEDMLFLSFPGDENVAGGCLAAGRGFFHINPNGGAEPCPFSPYSDTNVMDGSLIAALNSPLFVKLRDGSLLARGHVGGCVLFENKEKVELLRG